MTGGRVAAPQPNAGQLAMALVASAKIFGIAPDAVFVGNQTARRTRILAGAALKASTGCAANHLATTLRLQGPELAPSMVAKAGVTTDMMLEVVEALHGGLPKQKADARPLAPATEAKRAPCKAAPKPKAAAVKSVPIKPVAKAETPVAAVVQTVAAAPMRYAVPQRKRGRPEPKPVQPAAPSPTRPSAVQRLKPMTAAKLRFGRWFVAAGWEIEDVAELFDVHEDALADALEFGVAA